MAFDPNLKTLIIDDMAVMRKMVSRILSGLGFLNLDMAEDGKQALDKIMEAQKAGQPFQFIVSDWNMPRMTGLELLKELRGKEEYKKLPFLMVTAEGEKENLILAIKSGVSNFIVKPFTPETMKEKIDKIFP